MNVRVTEQGHGNNARLQVHWLMGDIEQVGNAKPGSQLGRETVSEYIMFTGARCEGVAVGAIALFGKRSAVDRVLTDRIKCKYGLFAWLCNMIDIDSSNVSQRAYNSVLVDRVN
ncbi:hypothetical protein Tco_0668072 [Tanacetum coccineum]